MSIVDEVRAAQNEKEMTRRVIKMILAIAPDDPEGLTLAAEFEKTYHETI